MAKPRTPRPATHFLFFAAIPPAKIADQIAEAWQTLGTGENLRADKLHMTLLPLTEVPTLDQSLIDAAIRAGDGLVVPPFEIAFDHLSAWHGRPLNRPLVLATQDGHSAGADALVGGLQAALPDDLHWQGWSSVRPHLTLAYGKGFSDDLILPRPIRWRIDKLVLVDSLRGRSRHVHLASWPLRD